MQMPCDLLLLCAEGINCGLDFKKALKDSEDQQLVKFQGSPQVGSSLSSQMELLLMTLRCGCPGIGSHSSGFCVVMSETLLRFCCR